jgi:Rrf2 family protein
LDVPAKVDYGIRALLVMTATGRPMTAQALAADQDIPAGFLGSILNDLRRAGIIMSQRGRQGGYVLARPADTISLASVMRVLDGPLAQVRGQSPDVTQYGGAAIHLRAVWIAVRANLGMILETLTLVDVVLGRVPTLDYGEPAWPELQPLSQGRLSVAPSSGAEIGLPPHPE